MSENRFVEVVGPGGLRGSVDTGRWALEGEGAGASDPGTQIHVQLDDGRELMVPRGALRRLDDGRYTLEAQGGQGPVAVIPVVREEAAVTTREVERGGVRVRKVSREREEIIDTPLHHEQVTIDRVAVQREVSGPLPVREEDGVVIVPLVEEVVVVRKTWVLREEIRINKQRFEVQRPRRVTLRTEEAIVERLEPPATGGPAADAAAERPGQEGAGPPEPRAAAE